MDQAAGFESRWMRGKSNRSFVISRRSFNDFAPMPIKFRAVFDGIGQFRWRQGAHAIGKLEQLRLGAAASGFQRLSSSRKPFAAGHHRAEQWCAGQSLVLPGKNVAAVATVVLLPKNFSASAARC
jgi:hypothetical protein